MISSTSVPEPSAGSAAHEVFSTPEILASILGHLGAEEFAYAYLAHQNVLKVAKQYPELRRQFFLEQEHGHITDGCRVNPLFAMVLQIFHWRFFKVFNDPTVFADPGFQFVIDKTIFRTPPTDAEWSLLDNLRPLLQEMLFAQATGPLEVWPRTGPLNVEPKSDYGRDSITFPPIYVPENEKSVWDVLSTILELELQSRVKYKIAWQEDNLDYVLHNGRIGLANLADAVDYVWKHRLHGIAAPSKAWYIPPRDEDFLKGIYRDPAEDYTAEAILHRGHADSKVDNCELCAKGVGV